MDFETAFDLVTRDCRRSVVAVLHETSPISRRRLTARIAARQAESRDDPRSRRPDRPTRRRIRIALHHNHLPKLADMGVIEYDEEMVAATPELEVLMDRLESPPRKPTRTPDRTSAGTPDEAPDGTPDGTPDGLSDHLAAFYA